MAENNIDWRDDDIIENKISVIKVFPLLVNVALLEFCEEMPSDVNLGHL